MYKRLLHYYYQYSIRSNVFYCPVFAAVRLAEAQCGVTPTEDLRSVGTYKMLPVFDSLAYHSLVIAVAERNIHVVSW